MNTKFLILIAIIMTVFTGMLIRNQWGQSQPTPVAPTPAVAAAPAVEPPHHILIAKHELLPGSFIQPSQDIQWGDAPAEPIAKDNTEALLNLKDKIVTPPTPYIYEGATSSFAEFNGSVVRHQIHAGEPVLSTELIKSNEGGFLSAVLAPGMCAVTIAVNVTSGNGGFISPGNRIDLIATHHIKSAGAISSDDQVVSENFVHNVRVVAVDQMLDNPDNKAIMAKTVTVEVSPEQAELVAVASERGKISTALLSTTTGTPSQTALVDGKDANPEALAKLKPAAGGNLPVQLPAAPQGGLAPHMMVIHGDQVQDVEFYKGRQ